MLLRSHPWFQHDCCGDSLPEFLVFDTYNQGFCYVFKAKDFPFNV